MNNSRTSVDLIKKTLDETKEVLHKSGYLGFAMDIMKDWIQELFDEYVALGGDNFKQTEEEAKK